jgi:hypothetical protein
MHACTKQKTHDQEERKDETKQSKTLVHLTAIMKPLAKFALNVWSSALLSRQNELVSIFSLHAAS